MKQLIMTWKQHNDTREKEDTRNHNQKRKAVKRQDKEGGKLQLKIQQKSEKKKLKKLKQSTNEWNKNTTANQDPQTRTSSKLKVQL